ncbi:proline-rich protein 36-like [Lampris incognitus]|uniref:proline-rich protein 36-like n=1 Tax=Lampris incognitus TaxID=2546036 RepID=UPI0024B48082|nr:proline-rich protein 36-like [Lampris incognitus]
MRGTVRDYERDCVFDYVGDFKRDYKRDCERDYKRDYERDYKRDYKRDYERDYEGDYLSRLGAPVVRAAPQSQQPYTVPAALHCLSSPPLSQQPSIVPAALHCPSSPPLSQQPSTVSAALHCLRSPPLSQQPSTVPAALHCPSSPTLSQQPYTVPAALHCPSSPPLSQQPSAVSEALRYPSSPTLSQQSSTVPAALHCPSSPPLSQKPSAIPAALHCPSSPPLSQQPSTVSEALHYPSSPTLSQQSSTVPAALHCPSSPPLSQQLFTVSEALHCPSSPPLSQQPSTVPAALHCLSSPPLSQKPSTVPAVLRAASESDGTPRQDRGEPRQPFPPSISDTDSAFWSCPLLNPTVPLKHANSHVKPCWCLMSLCLPVVSGSVNRPVPVPAFLRSPAVLPPPLDMKPFLQFPLETPHHAGIGLFPSFSTMDPVQKAVMSHTFGPPVVKTKRPIISCNVCQIRFNSESQAEAHYKGNRHARRVKGIETSKTTRPQEGDKQHSPLTASPMPSGPSPSGPLPSGPTPSGPSMSGPLPSSPEPDTSKKDDAQFRPNSNGSTGLPPLVLSSADTEYPLLPPLSAPLAPSPSSPTPSPSTGLGVLPGDAPVAVPPDAASPAPSPSSADSEEEKAKKLLYCSLCKVAVNSLSQLEAHNKGTKHKTIMEARSGLGPIKAYPRLGPKPSSEPGGGQSFDPNSQERTFHCEICNVRVNSELQLKQHISSRRHRDGVAGKPNPLLSRHKKRTDFLDLPKSLGPGLLPNPLAVAAAMAAAVSSNQLALRPAGPTSHPHPHPHPHSHLLQGTPLSLLRPAPGPIRTTHGPILFTPY